MFVYTVGTSETYNDPAPLFGTCSAPSAVSQLRPRAKADCSKGIVVGRQNNLDANWNDGTANWSKDANLQWLTNFTTR